MGLWDVNHILPWLDEFAEGLTGAQTTFCFQSVDVSAPLGTWRHSTSKDPAAPKGYIDGKEVADKLHDHVPSLGMNKLICITAFALEDHTTQNIALWNQDEDLVVSIVSASPMLEQMVKDRPLLHRFLANMVVAALGEAEPHTTPPTNCPSYYSDVLDADPKARLAFLTAKQEFCDVCRKAMGDLTVAVPQAPVNRRVAGIGELQPASKVC